MAKVGIIMGSDSDLPVMKEAAVFLEGIGIAYSIDIVSAHRTPEKMYEYGKSAKSNGINVIIAGAGGAAHLPGMMAALTALPVIGVPIKSSNLSGIDSLYSIVQMPGGIPVATVAINGALNAGILAASIIGSFDKTIYDKVVQYKDALSNTVKAKSEKLAALGYEKYLDQ